ncbi:hypothetical protein JD844_013285 [Phrynosoma platyrhinos]|uniref:1-acyl-sn-glycerol-3-phosphate acyltransferase n=1 Tax=Phrynosoma platyrhinos TaxID=52577 RepID=A0ABQ7TKL6_PHRPL|nr:hypothetical protein JD844_013285 [Phrynosoma platyrhinos]
MDMNLVPSIFLLSVVAIPLLYLWSDTVKYYSKVGFILIWIGMTSIVIIILCAHRGQNIDNMRKADDAHLGLYSTCVICSFGRVHNRMLNYMTYFLGIKVKVQGLENLPDEDSYVMVANHQGALDFSVYSQFFPPRCVPICKKEFLYMGPLGLAFWLCGYFFIDRQHRSQAITTMLHIQKTMLTNKFRIFICPEGTRNYSTSMLPFKHGAFHLAVQAQVPVVPVVISSYKSFFNKKEKKFTKGKCIVQILPKVETQGLNAENVAELTNRVRDTMLNVFYQISEVKQ